MFFEGLASPLSVWGAALLFVRTYLLWSRGLGGGQPGGEGGSRRDSSLQIPSLVLSGESLARLVASRVEVPRDTIRVSGSVVTIVICIKRCATWGK